MFICPGARYNRIYPEKENSYSVYNIGTDSYNLVFDKNALFAGIHEERSEDDDYGFISSNITLNGFIQYDRYPEKGLFPAISGEEYKSLSLDWKKVYASYEEKTRTTIDGIRNISIFSENHNNGSGTIIEVNSGWFNIREKKINRETRRFADFNRDIIYPDYVRHYKFNNEPEIRIRDKTLTQRGTSEEGNEKVVKMFTPGTGKQTEFLDWLKLKTIIKDLAEFVGMLFE